MKRTIRILFILALITGHLYAAIGDKGKRKSTKIALNVKAPSRFTSSLNFNLRNGLKYTGTVINTPGSGNNLNTVVTYRKGNSIYVLPYKQKVLVADMRQGYTGTKLIIKVP